MGVRVAFLDARPGAAKAPPRPAVLVPADAVRAEGTGGTLFVHAGDRVERRSVTLGQTIGTEREVLTGLKAGERVVVAPPASLQDGARVRVAEPAR
jgi:multidrug efflux pump subunit AcrA (membrane-fusion protein)